MSVRPYLLALWLAFGMAGCGLDDSARVDCRCTEDTDLQLFPACRDTTFSPARSVNPFAARLPDCPGGKRLSLLEPTRAEFVLFNIRTAFEGFSPLQYMDQLTEDFLFIPEPEGVDLYREVYNPPEDYVPERDTLWARPQERRFAVNLLDRQRFQKIEFRRWYESSEDERTISEDGRREVFIFPCEIEFTGQAGSGEEGFFAVKGRMEVELVAPTAENPVWSLRRWQDFRDPASAKRSWTELRGLFSR